MPHFFESLVCPRCGAALNAALDSAAEEIRCGDCATLFERDGAVPLLFWPDEDGGEGDVTEIVQAFYEETPFPDYDDLDSSASLAAKARRGLFAKLLDEQIPDGARVLDAGCGTGQLSNFLGLRPGRTVVGADVCRNSLKLAETFRRENRIEGAAFMQMNLFRPVFPEASFDLVVSNGVLHHTGAPRRGFETLSRLVKPGGFFVLGLYNTFGRLTTDLRRLVFRLSGDRFRGLDPRLRSGAWGETKKKSWFEDQYKHPHESKHTMGEVLHWLDGVGFEWIRSVPGPRAFQSFSETEKLFRPGPRGSMIDRFFLQAGMALKSPEGGLFVMIGRRVEKKTA